jgi:hypothetical protein
VIAGCSNQPVVDFFVPEAICQTSFAEPGSHHVLSAEFVPANPMTLQGSSTRSWPFNVAAAGSPPLPVATPTLPGLALVQLTAGYVQLTGLSQAHPAPRLRLRAHLSHGVIRTIVVSLPKGLSFTTSRVRLASGVSVEGASQPNLTVRHGALMIVLKQPLTSVTLSIGRSALTESNGLSTKLRRVAHARASRSLEVVIVVNGRDRLSLHPSAG